MTIPVVCPHCDSTFQLAPDLAGKAMRCPNPDCREVFTVAAAGPPPLPPPPLPTSKDVGSVMRVLDTQPFERIETSPFTVIPEADPDGVGLPAVTAARLEAARSAPPPKRPQVQLDPFTVIPEADPDGGLPAVTASLLSPAAKVPTAARLPAPPKPKPAAPVGPKEKVWSGDAPPAAKPTAPAAKPPTADEFADDEPGFTRTKRRKTPRGRGLLIGAVSAVVLVGLVGGFLWLQYVAKSEDRAREAAETAYKDANYPFAKTQYEGLVAAYPTSKRVEEYQFFTALSGLRAQVGSVGLKDDPTPARAAFDAFVAEWGANPLAQPESGFGGDLYDAGKRLADGTADHGDAKLKSFRDDRAKNAVDLALVKPVAESGLALLPGVDKFRDKSAGPLDGQRARFDGLIKGVEAEEKRLAVLAPFRSLPEDPTAARITDFQTALTDNKLDADDEALRLLADAEREYWKRIGYTAATVPAPPPAADGPAPVLLSVAPADRPEPRPTPGAGVAFAVARGVLFALDLDTGRPRWGARVAPPTADPQALDLPTRLAVGGSEWALVASEADGKNTLSARVVETGQVVWQQPLDAPAAGRAVVAAGRVYLPLRDPLGTVAEFDIASGGRTGSVQLRQPVGAGIAVAPGGKPGQVHLFIPGDAKRVFVFEVGREDAVGRRLPPRPVKALLTDHPKDSLRCEPVVSTTADGDGERTLLLCQGDAPTVMKVRAFSLPPASAWADAAATPADPPAARPSELNLKGWAWSPPASDGERLLLATDAPAVYGYGLHQPGTDDRPLFQLPGPAPAADQEGVNRSQVVAADEDGCWVMLAGQLQRLAVKVDPLAGLTLAPAGTPVTVGQPLHRPQAVGGRAVVVTRLGQAGAVQATAFDLLDGRVLWQRRLGLLPAGPAVASSAGAVLADEDGSVYLLPDGTTTATPLAAPFPTADGKAVSVTAGDGAVWVLAVGTKPESRQLRARRVFEGKLTDDRTLPLPEQLAGAPVGFGPAVLVPLANGILYRLTPGADKLDVGPPWRGSVQQEGAACFLGAVGPDEFVATDGANKWLHWKWAAGEKADKLAGPYAAAEPLAAAPVRLDMPVGPRFVAADVKGAVGLYEPGRLTTPVKRWAAESGLPPGKPADRLLITGGRVVACFDRRILVGLDPEADQPAWTVEAATADAGELAGWRADGAKVVATDLAGRVLVIDAATGKQVGEVPACGPPAAAPQAAGLVVYTDGTAGRVVVP